MRNITVVTFASNKLEDYCQTLYYSMQKLKSGLHNINFVCGTTTKKFKTDNFKTVHIKSKGIGGLRHAYLIAETVKHLNDVDIVIICDCDIVVLYENWDELIVNKLERSDVFGVRYEKDKCYQNFPCAFFMALNKKSFDIIKNFDYNFWCPGNKEKTIKQFGYVLNFTNYRGKRTEGYVGLCIDKELQKVYDKKVGDIVYADTGFRLPIIGYINNLKAYCLNPVKIKTKYFCNFPYVRKRNLGEWEYEGKTFLVHLSHCRRKYEKASEWKNYSIEYIRGNS